MNYIKQVWYEMRHQKMMTWVSISGTALSIFLVMAFFMTENAKLASISPETDRGRIMTGQYIELCNQTDRWSSSGGLSYEGAKRLYEGLKGVEKQSYSSSWNQTLNVGIKGEKTYPFSLKNTDDEFWKMFDFKFLYGKPYDAASVESVEKKAVVTRSVARKVFKRDDVVGEEIRLNRVPYVICGVVENVSPLLKSTYADIFTPLDLKSQPNRSPYMGNVNTYLLLEDGVDPNSLRRQVEQRYKSLNAVLAKEKIEANYHGQPYDADQVANGGYGSNTSPDLKSKRNRDYLVYLVLLLIPAINLSSMTRSRLRHRISEIGVRRAFGAKRTSILAQMLGENFIITLTGGIIGLALSMAFMLTLYDVFFPTNIGWMKVTESNPTLEMFFTWKTFFIAVLFCFVLNLFSAFLPSWRASRVEPAEAISKTK